MDRSELRPEIWGGIECTINRVGDQYFDQLEMSGHYNRQGDIDALCATGITSVRYPVLWERYQPVKEKDPDFSEATQRLQNLKQNGMNVIAGLVHHGSGPSFTSLGDPEFPELLANYAGHVARTFPWIKDFTPVNEPLTTARFSGLYGIWYPHRTNDVNFLKMLLNELKGTVLAMQAIRKIIPGARLIQTEDLSKTYSTPLLRYQAKFENNRRWLTYDILCGKLNEDHPLWNYFTRLGFDKKDLDFFRENPCPPDVLGVNYYVTSERYLDENVMKYPSACHGGNSIHQYADVEAIRARVSEPTGFRVLMKELWNRYRIPIAVTEAHLHCAREEQLIWFMERYRDCKELLNEGLEIKAITSWAMLGSFGWSRLLTGAPFEYERGAFDVSSGKLRPTAMAALLRKLKEEGDFQSPATTKKGWWQLDNRFYGEERSLTAPGVFNESQPLLIIGKRGTLGRAFARICEERNLNYILVGRDDMNICCYEEVEKAIFRYDPWAIINAAGYVRVDDAESERMRCFQENANGPRQLAIACRRYGVKLLTFSSDLVFNGRKDSAYLESDKINPLNVYGSSKAMAESLVSTIHPSSLIIRTSSFFGPWDEYNFVTKVLNDLSENRNVAVAADVFVTPTYVPDLVNASLDLMIDDEKGIWHLTNYDKVSWYELATNVAGIACYDQSLIEPVLKMPWKARRPVNSALDSEKGKLLPSLNSAIGHYFENRSITV